MSATRDRARQVLSVVPEPPGNITSKEPTKKKWDQMIPISQETLQKAWKSGSPLTTCMEFVAWYGRQMGAPINLGRFDINTVLSKSGQGNCWVKSNSGAMPGYGDIYLVSTAKDLHIGIALDNDASSWNHVDSGQGGPKTGYDIIKRTYGPGPLDRSKIIGWIDIDAYFAIIDAMMPNWLKGWWVVKWRGDNYYYHLTPDFKAVWSELKPLGPMSKPNHVEGSGTVKIETDKSITITWDSGSVENYWTEPTKGRNYLSGKYNDLEYLSAKKF